MLRVLSSSMRNRSMHPATVRTDFRTYVRTVLTGTELTKLLVRYVICDKILPSFCFLTNVLALFCLEPPGSSMLLHKYIVLFRTRFFSSYQFFWMMFYLLIF
ncbi:hypothetical protein VPH35_053841 [Triticum aestivum]|uniref:Uncharacterized protein n=1 Tax=Triticum turgidum subsp. durum TaxID=4567 RepID=A0A9R1QQL1_TRITD|nr:unnamed protein product [Triticum turgidum subsp. durum]